MKLQLVSMCVASIALVAAGEATAAGLKILADAPPAETARVLDRQMTSADAFKLGTPVKDTHTIVNGVRGSLAVGLIFGPLGVAANEMHANSV